MKNKRARIVYGGPRILKRRVSANNATPKWRSDERLRWPLVPPQYRGASLRNVYLQPTPIPIPTTDTTYEAWRSKSTVHPSF